MPLASKIAQDDARDTGIVWSAIIAGAVAAAGLTVILAPIGAAFGVAAMSPWHSLSAEREFSIAGAIWLIIVQWLASGLGGYLTGRMRTEWPAAHMHEVYFRDTVHGFLSWALTTLASAGLVMYAAAQTTARTAGSAHEITPVALFLYALSLFIGAFIAAVAGALGGAHRDLHYETGRLTD